MARTRGGNVSAGVAAGDPTTIKRVRRLAAQGSTRAAAVLTAAGVGAKS